MAGNDEATVLHGRGASDAPQSVGPGSNEALDRLPTEADPRAVTAILREGGLPRLVTESRLAEGGMGAVDVALDRALGRRLAKKTILPLLRDEPRVVRMFLREARTTGQLDHPHIVPVHDLGDRDGELYFTMKLVQGQTLKERIRALPEGRPVDPHELFNLLDVVVKVCDALAFAHARGVVHCDVKSANVMVGDFGQVYLMDWGIARAIRSASASTAPGARRPPSDEFEMADTTGDAVLGTPAYMAPEQARGDRLLLDARADVFAVGAIVYEILARRPPYRGATRTETLELARHARYEPPRAVAGAWVPAELERIVCKAMDRSIEARYPDTDALRDDLVRFMRGGAEFPQTTFQAGTTILREGEEGNAAYIIVRGECEISRVIDGARTVLAKLGADEVFGETAILSAGPRTATVTAVVDTTVLVVTREALTHEVSALKPWMARLIHALAGRMRDASNPRRPTFVSAPPAPRVANQVMMHMLAWAPVAPDGTRSLPWSRLAQDIEAQMGAPPHTIHMAAAMYPELDLDLDRDTLTLRDPASLAARLAPLLAAARSR